MACSVCKALGYDGKEHNKRTCPHAAVIYNKNRPADKQGGRPVEHNYDELFADLSEPPTNPLELARWGMKITAKCLRATAMGEGNVKRNAEIVKLVKAMIALTPKDIIYQAQRDIKKDNADSAASKGKKDFEPMSDTVGDSSPMR